MLLISIFQIFYLSENIRNHLFIKIKEVFFQNKYLSLHLFLFIIYLYFRFEMHFEKKIYFM